MRPLHRYVLKPSNPVFQNVTAGVKVLKELVKLRELNRVALTQYTWAPYKKRRLGHRHSERRPNGDPGRGLTSTKYGSEGTNPADIFILNFQPPEMRGSQLLLFKPPVCVTATVANKMTMDFSDIFSYPRFFFFIFSFLLQPKLALLPGFCSQRPCKTCSLEFEFLCF